MNFLICGLGSIGYRHLKILRQLGDVGIWAYSTGKSTIVQKDRDENPPDRIFKDLETALEAKPDAALITNPTFLHLTVAKSIAEKGIPLFIDKPLDSNLSKVEEFRQVVEANQVPILVGYNLMFHPAMLKIQELLENQTIGGVIAANAHWGEYLPDWHPWEDYKTAYAARSDMGGGVVLTMCHELNYLTFLFGKAIQCKALEFKKRTLDITAEEGINILLEHETGVHSNVHLNYVQKPDRRSLDIIGEKGSLYWEPDKNEIIFDDGKNKEIYTFGNNRMGTPYEQSFYNQMEHFVAMVQKKVKPKVPLTKGIEDLELCTTILKEIGR
jgi:predicted dehydrogenase